MKKFFKYQYEILVIVIPIALIAFGVYKNESKPFEEVSIYDINHNDIPIKRYVNHPKEIDSVTFENNTTIAQNEKYIVKKDSHGIFLFIDKKSQKIIKKFQSDGNDTFLTHLIGKRCFIKQKSIYDRDRTLANNNKYIAILDRYGYLQFLDKKSKKWIRKIDMFDEYILSAKFSNKFLFFYTNGINTINLKSFKKEYSIGINCSYVKIFPVNTGVIVFAVVKNDRHNSVNIYLLYYRYEEHKKEFKFESIYRLKKVIYAIFMHNGDLHINLNDKIYKIYPKGDELVYKVE